MLSSFANSCRDVSILRYDITSCSTEWSPKAPTDVKSSRETALPYFMVSRVVWLMYFKPKEVQYAYNYYFALCKYCIKHCSPIAPEAALEQKIHCPHSCMQVLYCHNFNAQVKAVFLREVGRWFMLEVYQLGGGEHVWAFLISPWFSANVLEERVAFLCLQVGEQVLTVVCVYMAVQSTNPFWSPLKRYWGVPLLGPPVSYCESSMLMATKTARPEGVWMGGTDSPIRTEVVFSYWSPALVAVCP